MFVTREVRYMQTNNNLYEVLNPWADADSPPLKGLAPRLTTLEGKTIGLLTNMKRSARPILEVIETRLKQRFPTLTTSWYESREAELGIYDGTEEGLKDRQRLKDWLQGVDAVLAASAD